ncbi:MAG: arginine--tRNA ligase [Nitrospinota bacterium]|nr:arginine--tRNA ligase [Nitrospinota bacterium]
MRITVRKAIEKAYKELNDREGWGEADPGAFDVSPPREEKFGDFSTNLAMILAARLKKKPRDLAEKLAAAFLDDDLFESVEVAGPGFMNFRLKPVHWARELSRVSGEADSFGRTDLGQGEKVMVEFVSANPTGPLHIGHGRGAAVGDALASILAWAGYDVTREYYTNDVGLQMDNLGRSTLMRAREAAGNPMEEEPPYRGEYMKDVARAFIEKYGPEILSAPDDEALTAARRFASESIMEGIRKDLADFNVRFDVWYSEKTLHDSGSVDSLIGLLLEKGLIYEQEGALWLKTGEQGDEKDRVVRRANGVTTYLAADIAYHKTKLDREFSTLVNIWGADHHGYVPRMKAVISALGGDPEKLVVRLVQLVSLKKGGQSYAMSTREGVFTTLRQIIDEVGTDAVRYFFLMRSSDSQMEFDVDLAKSQSSENPVYYVQYAHARCCSIFRQADEKGVAEPRFEEVDLSLLTGRDELRLIRKLLQLPEVVELAARSFQPHHITGYLYEVAGLFHFFYKHNRVVSEDSALTASRMALIRALQITLKNGLEILGINAPEKM